MRYIMSGMFDRYAQHGPITGSGPNFKKAMAMFKRRQKNLSKRGIWDKGPASYKTNDGKQRDPYWYIINYGQEYTS